MKTIALILASTGLLAFFGITIFQQKPDIPQVVVDAFWQKYPEAKSVDWEEEGEEYEAEFKIGKVEMSANFAKSGEWLKTETEIDINSLPDAVRQGITTNFPNSEIEEAEQLELPNQALAYEVELEGTQDQEIETVFAADGRLLSKKVIKEEAEEHDDDDH